MTGNTAKKQSHIFVLLLIFLAGFLSGVGFSVWKMKDLHFPEMHQGTQAETSLNEQIATLLQHLEKNPNDGNGWTILGNLYYDTQQPEKAIAAYHRSLEIQPGSPDLLTDLGVMYRRTNQPEKAIQYFNEAIARDSSHIPSLFNKGVVLLNDLHRPDDAIVAWEEIVRIDPTATTSLGQRVTDIIEEIKKDHPEQDK